MVPAPLFTRVCDVERCSTPRQRHAQLRLWTDAVSTCRLALARCGKPSQFGVTVMTKRHTQYLADCCVAASDIAGRQRLHLAHRRQLDVHVHVPRYQRSTLGRLAFSVTVWNSLPDDHRSKQSTGYTSLQSLKTLLFMQYYISDV